jgi:hypothetical protein
MQQELRTVEHWAQLSREQLVTEVTATVRRPPADPSRFWSAVAADAVLAATVRGILSGLLRDKANTRDEVYWTYRVHTVRAALNAKQPAPAARRTPTVHQESTHRPEAAPALTETLSAAKATTAEAPEAVPAIEFRPPGH